MADHEHDLHIFMAQVSDEMASEYKRIYDKTAEDPGTAGDEGEENWATLLRDWLPSTYHVATKGRLISAGGKMSPQIDVLVLKPFYPIKLREKKVWLADGVAAVFECKTTLRAEHVKASASRCREFKSLFSPRKGSPERELRSSLIYGILAHSHAWKAPGSKPSDNINAALDAAMSQAQHPSELIDILCVADVGNWSSLLIAKYLAEWGVNPDALKQCFEGDWGPTTQMVDASLSNGQAKEYRPLGGMLGNLTQRLAWNDPTIRDLADYYRLAKLGGQGRGVIRPWSQNVYSGDVIEKVNRGQIRNEGDWSGWNLAIV